MRSYDKYRDTRFIQKSDVERGILVTIDRITEEDVSMDDQPEKIKYVIHFKENFKPWVPGIETLEEINIIAGTGDVDNWPGTLLVLFVDPEVRFGGKKLGGIRCRAPKAAYSKQQQITEPQQEETTEEKDDDIPF